MKKKYWFKRRRYGYGWTPVTAQGWGIVIGYLVLVMLASLSINDVPQDTFTLEVAFFLMFVAVLTSFLITISYKMGPPPKWRWGSKPSDDPKLDF